MKETGLIFEVKRFAVHDGPGIRTTLFLKGCPLKCKWCHNPESISPQPQLAYYEHKCINCGECADICPEHAHSFIEGTHYFDRTKCISCGKCEDVCLGNALRLYGKEISVGEALKLAVDDRDFYGNEGGVTLSGGEPLLQGEFCFELLKALKQEHIHTAVDTCGFVNWNTFEKILPVTDMFLFDLKHSNSTEHKKLTGQRNEIILENLERLSQHGACVEVRMPLIPEANDSEQNICASASLLEKLNIESVKLLPFHAMAKNKYSAIGMQHTMSQENPPEDEFL
jgi:pyruvate formate lyase activating enzyme